MVIDYPLYGEPCTLAITLWCDGKQNLQLIVEDGENE